MGVCIVQCVPSLKDWESRTPFAGSTLRLDPLYHNIGKLDRNPKTGETEFYDLGCDFSILDVVKSTDYATKLKSQPIGTIIEATDPDGDRLIVCEIEDASRAATLEHLGIDFLNLGDDRLLTIYTPNQAFLMLMDFYAKQLKTAPDFGRIIRGS